MILTWVRLQSPQEQRYLRKSVTFLTWVWLQLPRQHLYLRQVCYVLHLGKATVTTGAALPTKVVTFLTWVWLQLP